MKFQLRHILALGTFAVLASLFVNCGGGFVATSSTTSSEGQSTPSPNPTPGPSPTPTPGPTPTPTPGAQPPAATSGTPKITQIRNGQVVATYTKLGEAFARTHAFRNYEAGDIFELDAAVYLGDTQQPWIGPLPKDDAEFNKGLTAWQIPTGITIRGLTQNGVRPVIRLDSTGVSYNNLGNGIVYIDTSKDITIENIDFEGAGNGSGKAAIYLNGAENFTLRNSRILNFAQTNGVFGTSNNKGIMLFENVETGFNGGDSGPEHNYYMGESANDPNFTVHWRGCYSHDVYYGHTLKSRAQINIVESSYLKGRSVGVNDPQGETYLVDFPNGGKVTVRNTILEKGYSGDNSNGIFITYAMEGQHFPNASSVTIEHNTFVARSLVFDSQGHELYPMNFYYPPKIPGAADFPAGVPVVVRANVFSGFLERSKYYNDFQKYRGTDFIEPLLTGINADFTLKSPTDAMTPAASQLMFSTPIGSTVRTKNTYGALD